MKQLPFIVVLLGMTTAMIAFRGLFSGHADASRRPDLAVTVERSAIDEKPRPEGAALDFVPATGEGKDTTGGEKLMARLAADCAAQLYEKSKKQPGNVRLLQQAAAHYRACLSHEPTVGDATELFTQARKNLTQIEALLARAAKPAQKRPAMAVKKDEEPAAPTPAPASAPAAQPKVEELIQVGPDGSTIRKLPPESR